MCDEFHMDGPSDPRGELARLIAQRKEDFAGLSRMLGRNSAYIQQYIKRGVPKRLSEEDRRKLASYFGVDEFLLGGPPYRLRSAAGLIPIPSFDVRASAGHGAFVDGEITAAHLAFDRQFLKELARAQPVDLSIIRVRGESMEPTLSDGDDVMVDSSVAGTRLHDGIYVLRRNDALIVKRIAVNPSTGKIMISSDNASFPSWPDCDPGEITVIGRVRWAGRKIS